MSVESILIDWIHLVSAAIWVGSLIFISLVFYPVMDQIDPKERGKAMQLMGKRFAKLVTPSVILLYITGLRNLPQGISWSSVNDTGDYFVFLNIKILIVLTMTVVGFFIPLVLAPKTVKLAPKPGEKPSEELQNTISLMRKLTQFNSVLGVVLLFFAATLLNGAQF